MDSKVYFSDYNSEVYIGCLSWKVFLLPILCRFVAMKQLLHVLGN